MTIPDKLRQIADEIEAAENTPIYYRPLAALLDRTEERKQQHIERQEAIKTTGRMPCANLDGGDCIDPTMDTDKCLDPANCPNYLKRECKSCGSR